MTYHVLLAHVVWIDLGCFNMGKGLRPLPVDKPKSTAQHTLAIGTAS